MTNIRNFTIAVLSATVLSGAALAQEVTPQIPGSETTIELNRAAERDGVAAMSGNQNAATVNSPINDTIVPGSDAQIDLNRAAERRNVAEGVDGVTVGRTETSSEVLVPGSGATFAPGTEPMTQSGRALQDEATTSIQ